MRGERESRGRSGWPSQCDILTGEAFVLVSSCSAQQEKRMLKLEVVSAANTKQGTVSQRTITFDVTCQGCKESSLLQME